MEAAVEIVGPAVVLLCLFKIKKFIGLGKSQQRGVGGGDTKGPAS